jgi:hypothetical protein
MKKAAKQSLPKFNLGSLDPGYADFMHTHVRAKQMTAEDACDPFLYTSGTTTSGTYGTSYRQIYIRMQPDGSASIAQLPY